MCTVNVHVQCARRRRNAPVTWSERGIYAMLGMWRDGARRAAVLRGMRGAHTAAAAAAAGTPAVTAVPASAAVESAVLAAAATVTTAIAAGAIHATGAAAAIAATAAGAIHTTGASAAAVSHDAAFGIRWTWRSPWLGRPEPCGDFCCAARSGCGDCIHSRDASAGAGAFQLIGIRNAERRHGLWRIGLWRIGVRWIGHRRIG